MLSSLSFAVLKDQRYTKMLYSLQVLFCVDKKKELIVCTKYKKLNQIF